MGQQGSRGGGAAAGLKAEAQEAVRQLTPAGAQRLEEEWRKLAAGESAVSAEKLGQWLGGTAAAGQIVLDAICQHLGAPALGREAFALACTCVTRGTLHVKAPLYQRLLGENTTTATQRLRALLPLAFARVPGRPVDKPSDRLVDASAAALADESGNVTRNSVQRGMSTLLFTGRLFDAMLQPFNVERPTDAGPPPLFPPQPETPSALCDAEAMLVIDAALPKDAQGAWRLLFDSAKHGGSFAKFRDAVTDAGPCLLIIKDKGGHIFGGFGSSSWHLQPTFYGDGRCFLFSLKPKLALYLASGANDNFQYLNVGVETLPNGLGMGGQFRYFGLFLANDLIHGHSKGNPSTTFANPPLSSSEEFEIADVEVWGVGGSRGAAGGIGLGSGKTVFDGRELDEAVLEMAGKTMHGKEFRRKEHEYRDEG